jgi:hypothetical protein
MRKLGNLHPGIVLGAALLGAAACRPLDTWSSRVEDPGLPPFAPEVLFRKPADFRLFDPHVRKEFFLYLYEDDQVKQELITVIDHALPEKSRRPRLATHQEHDYAMTLFREDWEARRPDEKLIYFNERWLHEDWRNRTLFDQKIVFKQHEIEALDEQRITLESDLKSRESSGAYAQGDEKFHLAESAAVQRELKATERRLLLAQGELLILEHLRAMRDARYARGAIDLVEREFDVQDLMPMYSSPDRLAEELRMKVQPAAWARPGAVLKHEEGGRLRIVQSRDVLLGIADYLSRLRSEFAAQRRK